MLVIHHRVNDLVKLADTPASAGVEVDIHAYGDRLVVHHDPCQAGLDFDEWLAAFRHDFVIFNIKEEGIEREVRNRAIAAGVERFFMLDLSFPALIKLARLGERRLAVRVSEYEPVQQALLLAGMVESVWLDVFFGFPINKVEVNALRTAGLKLCLVSPELHGREIAEITEMQNRMTRDGLVMDAVCTKRPDLWQTISA